MDCVDFQNELRSCVEARGVASAEMARHGESCSHESCNACWHDYLLLNEAVHAWRAAVPRVDLTRRVLTALAEERRPGPLPRPLAAKPVSGSSRPSALAPIAFALSGVAVLMLGMLLNVHAPSRSEVVQRFGKKGPLAADQPQVAVEDRAIRDVSARCVGWVEGATTRLSDAVTYVISPPSMSTGETPPDNMPSDWLKTWGERLQPLEESLDRSLRSILDETMLHSRAASDQPV